MGSPSLDMCVWLLGELGQEMSRIASQHSRAAGCLSEATELF